MSVNFPYALFSLLDFLTLKLGPTGFPEMSVQNYHASLCNISLERTPHIIWWCKPWLGSAWSGSEPASLVFHTRI